MKCINFLAGLFLLIAQIATAQSPNGDTAPEHYCNYGGAELVQIKAIHQFSSKAEAQAVMNDIVNVIGLVPNFVVEPGNVPNAAAWIHESKRYVLYNPTFIQNVRDDTRTDWGAISIMAHEIGHHLNGHTLTKTGSRPGTELEADEFSGFVLRKMGATLEEAQVAIRLLASPQGSTTHPPRHQRLEYIARGWRRADDMMATGQPDLEASTASSSNVEIGTVNPYPGRPPVTAQNTMPPPSFAQWKVDMVKNPGSRYYITKSNEFVLVKNGKVYQLGSFRRTSNEKYPFIIILENSPNLVVSPEGALISQNGDSIGRLVRQ